MANADVLHAERHPHPNLASLLLGVGDAHDAHVEGEARLCGHDFNQGAGVAVLVDAAGALQVGGEVGVEQPERGYCDVVLCLGRKCGE